MKSSILKILLLTTCLVFMADGFAQQSFQQSDLINKRWKTKTGKHTAYYHKFTNTKNTFIDKENQIYSTNYYYLSDSPDTVFDMSKVGKSRSGRYIITNYPEKSKVFIEEILLLTNNTLIFKIYPYIAPIGGNYGILFYHTINYQKTKLQKFQISDIAGKKWEMDSVIDCPYCKFVMEFKSNKKLIIWDIYDPDGLNSEYYLSDKIEKTFDASKLGKNQNGRYIIGLDSENHLLTYEILRLDNGRLILRDLKTFLWSDNGIRALHLAE